MSPHEHTLHPRRLRRDPDAWIAPNAVVVGDCTIGLNSSVWYGCVLRGDLEPVRIGRETNVQDLSLVHVDRGLPAILKDRVTVGHRSVVHGCIVEDDATIGMGAVVLSGSRIGAGAVVAAGAVVLEGQVVEPDTIVAGVPARPRGRVTDELRRRLEAGVRSYVDLARRYASGELGNGPHAGRGPVP